MGRELSQESVKWEKVWDNASREEVNESQAEVNDSVRQEDTEDSLR